VSSPERVTDFRSISAIFQETGAIKGHHAFDYSVFETTGQSFDRSGVENKGLSFDRSGIEDTGQSFHRFGIETTAQSPDRSGVPTRAGHCLQISALGQEIGVIMGRHAIPDFANLKLLKLHDLKSTLKISINRTIILCINSK